MLGTLVGGRYLVEDELGVGAMGRVYRARHVKLNQHVAVKVIHRELLAKPLLVARFEREARIAARVRHVNLVGVQDVGVTADGLHYMILELAPGRPLSDVLATAPPLDRASIIELVRQLLLGLQHAHAAGLVHRDLKPDNVLVDVTPAGRWVARIVDFGIAIARDDTGPRLTEANVVVGTPHYMSPEHATNRAIDHRTDLFALGVIVYELLARALPFIGTGQEVAYANVHYDPPPIAQRSPGARVDAPFEAFARKLMARKLDSRFQSAKEALLALDALATFDDEHTPPMLSAPVAPDAPRARPPITQPPRSAPMIYVPVAPSPSQRTAPIRRRSRRLWVFAIAAVVVAIVAIIVVTVRPTTEDLQPASAPVVETAPPVSEPVPVAIVEATVEHDVPVTTPAPPVTPVTPVTPKRRAVETPAPIVDPPAPATPAPPAVVDPIDANATLAARYIAIGKLLHGRPSVDPLWQRYRWIRLTDAMKNDESRRTANDILDAIENVLR